MAGGKEVRVLIQVISAFLSLYIVGMKVADAAKNTRPPNHHHHRTVRSSTSLYLTPATPEYVDEYETGAVGIDANDRVDSNPDSWRKYNQAWETRRSLQTPTVCTPIPVDLVMCYGVGYESMRLPNLLEHDSIKEVISQSSAWIHLVNIRCHPDTRVFLCSLFSPVCLDRPIWPCRSLCQAVQSGCETRMLQYGFPWPDMLNCSHFPVDNDLCIAVQTLKIDDNRTCSICNQSETFASIFDNFCNALFVMQVKMEAIETISDNLRVTVSAKKKIFKMGNLSKNEIGGKLNFYIENSSRCDCIKTALKGKGKKSYLAMGYRIKNRLVLTFAKKIEKKSKEMQKALKLMKNSKVCENGSQVISNFEGTVVKKDVKTDVKKDAKKDVKKDVKKDEKSKSTTTTTTTVTKTTTVKKTIAPSTTKTKIGRNISKTTSAISGSTIKLRKTTKKISELSVPYHAGSVVSDRRNSGPAASEPASKTTPPSANVGLKNTSSTKKVKPQETKRSEIRKTTVMMGVRTVGQGIARRNKDG